MALEKRLAPDQVPLAGGGGLDWSLITVSTPGVDGNGYLIDASAPVTVTLPATPSEGDTVGIADASGVAETYLLTVARNGENIRGQAGDLILDKNWSSIILVYANASSGWVATSEFDQAGGGGASSVVAAGFLQGLFITSSNVAQVVIKAGSKIGLDDGSNVITVGGDITVDITTSGVNGLDTGAEAINTWYYIYLIDDGATPAGLLSASHLAPTLPGAYTKKRLVGVVRNDGSSDFVGFHQQDKTVEPATFAGGGYAGTPAANVPIVISLLGGAPTLILERTKIYFHVYKQGAFFGAINPGVTVGSSATQTNGFIALSYAAANFETWNGYFDLVNDGNGQYAFSQSDLNNNVQLFVRPTGYTLKI